MELDEEFEEKYPNLNKELKEEKTKKVKIKAYRKTEKEAQEFLEEPGLGHYLKKCKNKKEKKEIIDWYLKQGKIDKSQATKLIKKLK